MAKKPENRESDEKTVDLDLEITDDELKEVAGGQGVRPGIHGARAARLKRLGKRDNPIGSFDGLRKLKKKR
jgi:hypothetical protein